MGQFGCRAVFVTFGLLAIPAALGCFLADGGSDACDDRAKQHRLLGASDKPDFSKGNKATTYYGYVELVEGETGDEQAARLRQFGESMTLADKERSKSAGLMQTTLSETALASPIDVFGKALLSKTKTDTAGERDIERALPLTIAAPVGGCKTRGQEVTGRDGDMAQEHTRLTTSIPLGNSAKGRDNASVGQRQQHSDTALLQPNGAGEGDSAPPFLLVALLAIFSFLYVGTEIGFGAWVAVVVVRDNLAGEAGAAIIASVYWGGITAGRLLAVPLAVHFSTQFLVRVNLLGGLLSSVLLLAVGKADICYAAVGAGSFGLFMASTFPLGMSLLPSAGYVLSNKNTSRMVIGGALGEMVVPAFIAMLLGPEDNGWPAALYAVSVAILTLLGVVYSIWCNLLAAVV